MTERYNELSSGVDTIEHKFRNLAYNVRGYGYTTAAVARIAYAGRAKTPTFEEVLLLGRRLSTLYALLLIIVVFCLGRVGGLSPPAAGIAALLMAAYDVNATYSHYMLPASGYIMFSYLALLGGVKLIRGLFISGLCFLALGAAGAGALLILLIGWRFGFC
ncbi:MAG: hypothetical protein OTI34_02685 [Lewinella sp.]|nr:hypothetical protein [Lewinella sp.]